MLISHLICSNDFLFSPSHARNLSLSFYMSLFLSLLPISGLVWFFFCVCVCVKLFVFYVPHLQCSSPHQHLCQNQFTSFHTKDFKDSRIRIRIKNSKYVISLEVFFSCVDTRLLFVCSVGPHWRTGFFWRWRFSLEIGIQSGFGWA